MVIADNTTDIIRSRCPEWMSEEYPKTFEREKQIYEAMLMMSKKDQIVKNLMIKAGKLEGAILAMKYAPINVPILFHVLTYTQQGVTYGTIPTAAFNKQIEVMNAAFVDTGITFSIQQIKTYSNSPYFSTCDDQEAQMKAATTVSPQKYMNVWTCNTQYLGFAYLPFDLPESSYIHGIVLNYRALPKVDGYSPYSAYNEGDTLVHEAGHFFGLYHTFQNGCNGGDSVSDTAAEATAAYGMACQTSPARDTCPALTGVDPVTNYMDYSDDACLDNFTPLQHARMRTMFITYKPTMAVLSPTSAPTKKPTKKPNQTPTLLPTNKPKSSSCESLKKRKCKRNISCVWQTVDNVVSCATSSCGNNLTEDQCSLDSSCKWKRKKCKAISTK